MNNISDDFILRFLNGKLSTSEIRAFELWINSSEENLEIFKEYRRIWLGTAPEIPSDNFNAGTAWENVQEQLTNSRSLNLLSDKQSSRRLYKRILQVAAMLILFLSVGAAGSWFFLSRKSIQLDERYCEIIAPPGSKSLITLPDGSKAWINAGSKLTYRSDFNRKDRVVTLAGEGYFSVTSDKSKPFLVQTAHLKVKAFGTIFNVKAYPEEKTVETTLVEGVVEIEAAGRTRSDKPYTYILKPKENLIYNIDSGIAEQKSTKPAPAEQVPVSKAKISDKEIQVISNVKPELYTSWKDENWVIEGMPLDKLAVLMGRRFNSRIEIRDDALKLYKFTGTIQNETLEQMLVILSLTTPLEYSIGKGSVSWMINKNLEKNYSRILKR